MGWSAWRIAALAWVAGDIDAFGYLTLGRVFISHVTGNTAVLTIALVQGNFTEALHRGMVIVLFFAGALAGAALVDSAGNARQVDRAIGLEALALAAFTAIEWIGGGVLDQGWGARGFMLLLLSGSMGLQNAALTRQGARGIHTTHITGPATDLAVELVRLVVPRRRHEFDSTRARRLSARLIGFAAGGSSGTVLFTAAPTVAPLLATIVLVGLALLGSSGGRQRAGG